MSSTPFQRGGAVTGPARDLGVTLAAMTLKAHARTVLVPSRYFPVAMIYSSGASVRVWVTIAASTNMIFLGLVILLFGELVKRN